MHNSQSILFVRWGGSLTEALELQTVLSNIVKNNFKILLLYPTGLENEINKLEWALDHVFPVQVSSNYQNKRTWYVLLKRYTLKLKKII